jgi:hypothetical protein
MTHENAVNPYVPQRGELVRLSVTRCGGYQSYPMTVVSTGNNEVTDTEWRASSGSRMTGTFPTMMLRPIAQRAPGLRII